MFKKYGSMILKKNTILYHVNDYKKFTYKSSKEKPFLFCTFHPSEWSGLDYVHIIKLKRDMRLLFMVNDIIKDRIYSALPDIIQNSRENLSKMNILILKKMKRILKNEHYNGWFSSIENKMTVEVALFNKLKYFEVIKSMKLKKYWRNNNCNNNIITTKNWGNFYKISFYEIPIILRVNKKFKRLFTKYKEREQKSDYPSNYIFQLILDNANIKYHS